MRRSDPLKVHGSRSSDPYQNLSPKQLELMGAIAMIYNDAEETVIDMCRLGLQLPINFREVLGRINGVEGIVEITKRVCEKWGYSKEERLALGETLGADGFLGLKKHRDGVIHSRVYDVATSIAKSKQGRGQIQDVLLSEPALQGLYDRLYWLERELKQLDLILARRFGIANSKIDREIELHEARIPTEWSRYLSHRNRRQSLPPLPEFPPDILDLGPLRRALDGLSVDREWIIAHHPHGPHGE